MIYRNGKRIGAIFRNGQSIGKIFRNGKLVWQKDKPVSKRIKSITVALPEWGTVGRIEWESILRAVTADARNYYLDATIRGVGVRVRGYGGNHVAEMSGERIALPESLKVTTDDLYVGQVVSFVARTPAVTSEPTYKRSNSSYQTSAMYEFATAPFLPGSSICVKFKQSPLHASKPIKWTIKGNLNGVNMADIAPAVTTSGSGGTSAEVVYADKDYTAMATYGTGTWLTLNPSFIVTRNAGGLISKVTLQSPESRLTYKFKIKKIETY